MFYHENIDPWLCMPLLGTIEFFKDSFRQAQTQDTTITTVDGFQPNMDNPIEWSQFEDFKQAVIDKINLHIKDQYTFERSWFVSYDKLGKQDIHNHKNVDVDFTGVVCLIGNSSTGAFCTDNQKIFLQQGDLVIFDSLLNHWTEPTELPKSILAFDCKYVG